MPKAIPRLHTTFLFTSCSPLAQGQAPCTEKFVLHKAAWVADPREHAFAAAGARGEGSSDFEASNLALIDAEKSFLKDWQSRRIKWTALSHFYTATSKVSYGQGKETDFALALRRSCTELSAFLKADRWFIHFSANKFKSSLYNARFFLDILLETWNWNWNNILRFEVLLSVRQRCLVKVFNAWAKRTYNCNKTIGNLVYFPLV